jgi:hypothetical protein
MVQHIAMSPTNAPVAYCVVRVAYRKPTILDKVLHQSWFGIVDDGVRSSNDGRALGTGLQRSSGSSMHLEQDLVVFNLLGMRIDKQCARHVGAIESIARAKRTNDRAKVDVLVVAFTGWTQVILTTGLQNRRVTNVDKLLIQLQSEQVV